MAATRVPSSARVDAVADRLDDAEHLHARGVRRGDGHRAVPTVDPVDVVEVEGDRVDAHPDLARSGAGRVDLLEPEDVARRAVLDRPPGAHDAAAQAAGSSASGRFDRPRTLLEYAR